MLTTGTSYKVLSFISQFSAPHRDSKTPTPAPSPLNDLCGRDDPDPKPDSPTVSLPTPAPSPPQLRDSREPSPDRPSPTIDKGLEPAVTSSIAPVNDPFTQSPTGRQRSNSRPLSMVLPSQRPLMESNEEIIPELQPIFALLSSHANKLYQEGYFLKLDDQDISAFSPPLLHVLSKLQLTPIRGETESGPNMDRVLCPIGGHSFVSLGCCRARCCRGRRRSASQIHQPH